MEFESIHTTPLREVLKKLKNKQRIELIQKRNRGFNILNIIAPTDSNRIGFRARMQELHDKENIQQLQKS